MEELTNKQVMDRLYGWSHELVLNDTGSKPFMTVYQRVIGDAVLEDARRKALVASRKLRLSLRDPNSEEYYIYIAPIYEMSLEEKILRLVNLKYSDFRTLAYSEVEKGEVPELSIDATQEEQENLLATEKAINDTYYTDVYNKTTEYAEKYKGELGARDEDSLTTELVNLYINDFCQSRMMQIFNEFCAFNGTFRDKKFTHLAFFPSEYSGMLTVVKNQIIEGYLSLELRADDLKN